MPFTGKVGDTLYLSDSGGSHRYVIITRPNDNNEVILVNFTSTKLWKDNSTIFRPRDDKHIFTVETSVRFSNAYLVSVDELIELSNSEFNKRKYRYCSENNIARIVKGALQSDFTPYGIIEELKIRYPDEYERYYHDEEDESVI
jgi:hypothetical protein